MRFLIFMQITESGNPESFYTEWYSSENFIPDVGMIVFDLALKQFTTDGKYWKDITEDHL